MWFRLCLEPCSNPLDAVVSPERDMVYWRIIDIAKLLGKKNPYDYAKAKRTVQGLKGQDVIRVHTLCANRRAGFCTTTHVYKLLHRENKPLANRFLNALLTGKGTIIITDAVFANKYKDSPLLMVGHGTESLPNWIGKFVRDELYFQNPTQPMLPENAFYDYLYPKAMGCFAVENWGHYRENVSRPHDQRSQDQRPHEVPMEPMMEIKTEPVDPDDPPAAPKVMRMNTMQEMQWDEWLIPEWSCEPSRIWVQQPGGRKRAYVPEQ